MRGEPERVGEIIRRCLEATDGGRFYRPIRPFKQGKNKQIEISEQLSFKFTDAMLDFPRCR